MAAITHRMHVPAGVGRTVHQIEKLACATVFTLLPPVAFALLILSGLLLAMGLASVL